MFARHLRALSEERYTFGIYSGYEAAALIGYDALLIGLPYYTPLSAAIQGLAQNYISPGSIFSPLTCCAGSAMLPVLAFAAPVGSYFVKAVWERTFSVKGLAEMLSLPLTECVCSR